MQRYQTEDEHRKAMRAKINKTIKRGRRRKRIIRRLRKAVPGICIGVLIAGMGAWCIAAPLPDPDDYEPYRFQAENGQWYTQEEYEQMSRERDAYHQREREEAEKEAQMIRDYQEQYQKDQEAEWKLYQEQTRTGLIHSMDFDASEAVNVPILANSGTEAMAALGYSVDFKNFTLCQTMFATSNLFQVSPVVYINVLDPAKHNKELAEAEYQVNQKQAVIEKEGIILEGLTVKNSTGDTELKAGEDYSAAFDSTTGFLTITMLAGGKGAAATAIKVSGKVIDPSKVTKEDVIGAVDPSTGAETGAQVIRQVYPRLGIVPGLILAPGWSQIPEVGLALAAKAAKINGVYSAMALLDLDTTKAKKYTDTKSVKEESGYTSPF